MSTSEKQEVTHIHVFVNRKKVEFAVDSVTGAQLLDRAGFQGQDWDLLELDGEGDPSGGDLILKDQVVELENGERFRVIPGNRTFGS